MEANIIYEIGFKNAHSDTPLLMLQYDGMQKVLHNIQLSSVWLSLLLSPSDDRKSLPRTYLALRNSEVDSEGFANHFRSSVHCGEEMPKKSNQDVP